MTCRAVLLALAGCAVAAPKPPVVATSEAAIGRLAPPPEALRPGVVTYPDLPALDEPAAPAPPPPMHHHHP